MRKFLAGLFLLLPSLALAQTHLPSAEAPGRTTFSFTPKELEVLNFAIGEQPCKIVCSLNLSLSMQAMQVQQQAAVAAQKANAGLGRGRDQAPSERPSDVPAPKPEATVPAPAPKPEAKAPANAASHGVPRTSPWPMPETPSLETPAQP